MTRILLVEDSDDHAEIVTRALSTDPTWSITRAVTAREGLFQAARGGFDLAIIDYKLPDRDGIDLLELIRKQSPSLPVLFFTAHGSEEVALRAMSLGASDYVVKRPHYQRELVITVQEVLARARDFAHVTPAVTTAPARAPQPRAATTQVEKIDAKAVAHEVDALVTRDVNGAAVFDAGGRPLAAKLPVGVDPTELGRTIVNFQSNAQAVFRKVPNGGLPRAGLLHSSTALVAIAEFPGPALVVLLFDPQVEPGLALARARDAAKRVWEAGQK